MKVLYKFPARIFLVLWSISGNVTACEGICADNATMRKAPDMHADLAPKLTEEFGCDEIFVAKNPESTLALVVSIPGILSRSLGVQLPYQEEIDVGDPGIRVQLEQGIDLDHWCTDIMARPPRIETVWVGVQGKASVTIEQIKDEPADQQIDRRAPARARLHLNRTIFVREDCPSEKLQISSLEIQATIGEPAGG